MWASCDPVVLSQYTTDAVSKVVMTKMKKKVSIITSQVFCECILQIAFLALLVAHYLIYSTVNANYVITRNISASVHELLIFLFKDGWLNFNLKYTFTSWTNSIFKLYPNIKENLRVKKTICFRITSKKICNL